MPQLPQYTAQIEGLPISGGRRASAEEFSGTAAALGGLARTGAKVGEQVMSRAEEEESRKALVTSSEIRAKYARLLDDAQTSGGDLDKLKEQMSNELSAVGDGFQTRKGADSLAFYTSNTELMFDEQSNRIAVTRAASTARLDANKFMTSASSVIQTNPTYLGTAIKDAEALIDGFQKVPPEKKAELKAELRQNLNMTAALASARIDPVKTRSKLEDGEWELSGEQRNLAINKTEEQINARRAADNHARAQADYERRERDEKATHGYMTKIVDGTLTGKALERAITADPDLDSKSVQQLTMFAEHRANAIVNGEKKSNPTVKHGLYLAAIAPEGTPGKIYTMAKVYDAVQRGEVNPTDANWLSGVIAAQRDESGRSFQNRMAGRLSILRAAAINDPVLKNTPGLLDEVMLEVIAKAEERQDQMRKAAEAGKGASPTAMFDRESKDHFFTPSLLKDTAAEIAQRRKDALPQPIDLRQAPDAWKDIAVDTTFVDPKGVSRVMTKELKDALKKGQTNAPAAATVPDDARSHYEQNRDKYGPEARMSFDRLMDLITGAKPTRETTAAYDRRKAGL